VTTGTPFTQLRKGLDRSAASLFNAASTAWRAIRHRKPPGKFADQDHDPQGGNAADPWAFETAFRPAEESIDRHATPRCASRPLVAVDPDEHAPSSRRGEAPAGRLVAADLDAAVAAEPAPAISQDSPDDAAASGTSVTSPGAVPVCESAPPAKTSSVPVQRADPELEGLRQRVARMQEKVFDLETRKADMDALIDEHAFRQYQALGSLLHEQLALRRQVLHLRAERSQSAADLAAAAAAAEELAAYEHAARGTPPVDVEVAPEIEDELRALYRSAAMRCHPDRVSDADKAHAHEVFLRTQDAYRRRDLEVLRLIDRQLGSDPKLARIDADRNALDHLQAFLNALEDKGVELAMAIHELQGEARYRVARQRERWEENFASLREQIENECAVLRREIARY
jgi:predicted  nucleic acid-binding Zn-ribbon protein